MESRETTGSHLDAPHPSRALVVTTTSDEFQVFSLQRDDFKLSDTLVEL